jgi:hypothetical protein
MFVLMVAALLLRLGTVPGVLVPLAAMVLPLLWAMGMLGAGGIPFQPMALTFPVILGWFSLAYGGWIVEGYQRFYQLSGDRSQALRAAYGELRPPAPILTAGLVLVSLHASDVPMIRDFAWLGLFWWMGTMVVVLLVLPALIQLLPAPGTRTGEPGPGQPRDAVIPMLSSGGRRPLLWCLLAAILLGGGVSAGRIEIGDNVPGPSYIRSSHRWNQCFRLMADKFMGPYQLLVYARAKEEGGLLEPEAVNAIGDLSRFLRHQGGARDTVAFDMMVTEARNMLMDGNPKWLTVPVSREQVKGMGELVVEQGGVESFIDETFTEATVSPFFPEKGTGAIDEYAVRIQAYLDRNPSELLSFRLGGGLLGMTKAVNDGTRDSYWTTLITAFILVFVSGIVMTRSLVQGIVITVPIAAAQAVVWMIMVVTGMKINMPVTLVTAAAVGFCSVFGYAYGSFRDGRFRPSRSPGAVLFPGTLVFVSGVPWFFIGLRFPSQMVLVFAMSVLLAAVLSTLFVPLLAGLGRTGPPNRASEEEHR